MSLNNSLFTHYTLRSLQPEPRTRDFGFKIVGDSQTYSIFVLTTVAPPGVFTGTVQFFLVYVPAPPGGGSSARVPGVFEPAAGKKTPGGAGTHTRQTQEPHKPTSKPTPPTAAGTV